MAEDRNHAQREYLENQENLFEVNPATNRSDVDGIVKVVRLLLGFIVFVEVLRNHRVHNAVTNATKVHILLCRKVDFVRHGSRLDSGVSSVYIRFSGRNFTQFVMVTTLILRRQNRYHHQHTPPLSKESRSVARALAVDGILFTLRDDDKRYKERLHLFINIDELYAGLYFPHYLM